MSVHVINMHIGGIEVQTHSFLGALQHREKRLIALSCLCLSVCPSVLMENSGPTGRIFLKFNLRIFRTSVEVIRVPLKFETNNGYLTKKIYINL